MYWGDKPFHSLDYEMKKIYGEKVYKLSLNGSTDCPNRKGGQGGCIFCSEGGSGDFAKETISEAKAFIANKKPSKYIAYFQTYTGTYGDFNTLSAKYMQAAQDPDIVAISIGTRPDCITDEWILFLSKINMMKPVWIELGLQTSSDETARFINRGYELKVFKEAYRKLTFARFDVIVHVIVGLPGESREDARETVRYVSSLLPHPKGIKIHLMHVLEGTALGEMYKKSPDIIENFSLEEYVDYVIDLIEEIPQDIVIHRITGDGPKNILIEPKWSGDKKRVLNTFSKRFKERNTYQGKALE